MRIGGQDGIGIPDIGLYGKSQSDTLSCRVWQRVEDRRGGHVDEGRKQAGPSLLNEGMTICETPRMAQCVRPLCVPPSQNLEMRAEDWKKAQIDEWTNAWPNDDGSHRVDAEFCSFGRMIWIPSGYNGAECDVLVGDDGYKPEIHEHVHDNYRHMYYLFGRSCDELSTLIRWSLVDQGNARAMSRRFAWNFDRKCSVKGH